jgi:hypothetical protein
MPAFKFFGSIRPEARRNRRHLPAHKWKAFRCVVLAVIGFGLLGASADASPSLETFVLSAGGRANSTFDPPCTGGSPPAVILAFFGVWGPNIPTAGLDACGVAGGIDHVISPTGPLSDDRSVVSSWPVGNSFGGSGEATADYGRLSAHAHAEFTGDYSNVNVTGSDAFGITDDGFTITSPSYANGQSGSVLFRITVSGALSTTSNSHFGVQLGNRVNNSIYLLFACYGNFTNQLPTLYSRAGSALPGFVRSLGAMSGSEVIPSDQIPFVFGTPFDYKLGLLTEAVSALSSIVDSDFEAAITGIEVKGPGGQPVTDFVVTSASGTHYGPSGVSGVGEFEMESHPLLGAFPNPASSQVELRFGRPMPDGASLEVFDVTGRRVRQLTEATAPGSQSVSWDGRNDQGMLLSSGLYFARLSSKEGTTTARFTLLR